MKSKTRVRLLYTFASMSFVGGLLILANTFFDIEQVDTESLELPVASMTGDAAENRNATLADFDGLWDKRLQGKPQPAPEPVAVVKETPQVPAKPPIQLPEMSLTGILYSNSFSLATFDVGGELVTCSVGEEVKGAKVEKIEPDQVTLLYHEKTFVRKPE